MFMNNLSSNKPLNNIVLLTNLGLILNRNSQLNNSTRIIIIIK